MADTDSGQWHRVCLNTIVRKGRELDSERLRILPMGSRVRVQETCDRRVRIDMPVAGWCSLRSSNGDTILSPLQTQGDSDGSMTPSIAQGNQKKYYENYKESLVKKQKNNEDALKLSKELAEVQANIAKAKQEINEQEELQRKVEELTAEKEKLLAESASSVKKTLDSLGFEADHLEDAQAALNAKNLALRSEIAAAENYISACRSEVQELKAKLVNNVEEIDKSQNDNDAIDLRPGDVVQVPKIGICIVRYFGLVQGQEGQFVGVELEDTNFGDTNGTVGDTEYFKVEENKGLFLPVTDIKVHLTPAILLNKLSTTLAKIEQLRTSQE